MRRKSQRERLLVRAARRIDDGAPARRVCRDLGITEAELAAWRWERAPEALWLAGRVTDLEWENRRLRVTVGDLRRHRRMLLDAYALIVPTLAPAPAPASRVEPVPGPRRAPSARGRGPGWVM
jgi:hypothetical protein